MLVKTITAFQNKTNTKTWKMQKNTKNTKNKTFLKQI